GLQRLRVDQAGRAVRVHHPVDRRSVDRDRVALLLQLLLDQLAVVVEVVPGCRRLVHTHLLEHVGVVVEVQVAGRERERQQLVAELREAVPVDNEREEVVLVGLRQAVLGAVHVVVERDDGVRLHVVGDHRLVGDGKVGQAAALDSGHRLLVGLGVVAGVLGLDLDVRVLLVEAVDQLVERVGQRARLRVPEGDFDRRGDLHLVDGRAWPAAGGGGGGRDRRLGGRGWRGRGRGCRGRGGGGRRRRGGLRRRRRGGGRGAGRRRARREQHAERRHDRKELAVLVPSVHFSSSLSLSTRSTRRLR